jgi:heme-degrading monooxygenase HmoA
MIDLNIHVEIRPIHHQEFLQIAMDIVQYARSVKGCKSSHLQRDMETSYNYEIETVWETKDDLGNYISSQSFGALLGAMKFQSKNYNINLNEKKYAGGDEVINELRNQFSK